MQSCSNTINAYLGKERVIRVLFCFFFLSPDLFSVYWRCCPHSLPSPRKGYYFWFWLQSLTPGLPQWPCPKLADTRCRTTSPGPGWARELPWGRDHGGTIRKLPGAHAEGVRPFRQEAPGPADCSGPAPSVTRAPSGSCTKARRLKRAKSDLRASRAVPGACRAFYGGLSTGLASESKLLFSIQKVSPSRSLPGSSLTTQDA